MEPKAATSPLSTHTITEKIHEGSATIVFRGTSNADNRPVVIKVSKGEYPAPRDLARLRHEFLLLKTSDVSGVVKAHGIEKYGNGLALILENLHGVHLNDFVRSQKPDVGTLLSVAISVVDILQRVHQKDVLHRDIKPQNILIDASHGKVENVYLIDFGSATQLLPEAQRPTAATAATAAAATGTETSLAYMAPEQTGRMNRSVDHRSDFYSLGVTLYEIFTGSLPFTTSDPVQLVHSHIARMPPPPHEILPSVPVGLSAVIMKLLAKGAEERYQSAHGLKTDLEHCLREWRAHGRIELFPLGRHDHRAELALSQKLYGRSTEFAELTAALDRVARGVRELVLLSGHPGVGKSALANELQKTVAERRGLFVCGRFEHFHRAVPYAALAQAIRELCHQLLTENAEELARWKETISVAVGRNGRLLTDLIPDLELLIGPQPPPPPLALTESQNRFNLVFQRFLQVFTSADHPLVLFFDDLQWADVATLNLLHLILTDSTSGHLLVIGAYRDTDAGEGHLLLAAIEELRRAGAEVHEIALEPLSQGDVVALLVDSLAAPAQRVQPLAQLLFDKTQGNPFFVNQFLLSLQNEKLLRFDFSTEKWEFDLPRIQNREVTDNVAEFMAGKIRLLEPRTQRALQLGAFIGTQFDLATIAALLEETPESTATTLWSALREGLCQPLDAESRVLSADGQISLREEDFRAGYRFVHERVREAAYSLTPPSEVPATHLRIARLMHSRAGGAPDDRDVFEVVGHFNRAGGLIAAPEERLAVARLDLRAGQRAKAATGYEAAATCLQAGIALLDEKAWAESYELAFNLNIEYAECTYLSRHFDQAEATFEILIPRLASDLDRARVATLRMELYASKGLMNKALSTGLDALSNFGTSFPFDEPEQRAAFPRAIAEFDGLLGARRIADLLALSACSDPEQLAVQRLLRILCAPAFFVRPSLLPLIALKLMVLSVQHGHTEVTAYAYVNYGVILANFLGRHQDAYAFGELALELNQRFGNIALTCQINCLHAGFINPYRRPIRTSLGFLQTARRVGLETGDFIWVGYACHHTVQILLGGGEELGSAATVIEELIAIVRRTRDPFAIGATTVARQAIANLTGQTTDRGSLTGGKFDEAHFVSTFKDVELAALECWYYAIKTQLAFLYADFEAAHRFSKEAQARAASANGLYFLSDLHFFTALTLAALDASAPPAERDERRRRLEAYRDKLGVWAESCPENFRHRELLVAAEIARIEGKLHEAHALYDQAIALAQKHEFPHHAALGSELCARALSGAGRTTAVAAYLREAYYGYQRWGATAKLAQLKEGFPLLASDPHILAHDGRVTSVTTSSSLVSTGALDIATVLHTAQSIASEIILDRLLEELMRSIAASAGAQRGFLLLERTGKLTLEASITVDPDLIKVAIGLPLEECRDLARSVVQYVAHTAEPVVLRNVSLDPRFAGDPYIAACKPKSLLALPLKFRGRTTGVLYLENNVAEDAFTTERIELLRLLSGQAAVALENALLYGRVQDMSDKLRQSNDELRQRNAELVARSEEVQRSNAELVRLANDLRAANARIQHELSERVRSDQERASLQEEVIRMQRARLAEIAVPLIPITDDVMVLPLIGTVDTERAQDVIETVLQGAQKHRARVVIIDVTGMKQVDTHVVRMLLDSAFALRLLGTQTILTGVRPEVAQTLVSLNLDLGGLVTRATLQSGIAYAMARLGGSLVDRRELQRRVEPSRK